MSYLFTCMLHFLMCFHVRLVLSNHKRTENTNSELKDQGWKIWCKFQPNSNDCNKGEPRGRFYYDIKLEDCKSFTYGECPNSYNYFNTLSECHQVCNEVGAHPIRDTNLTEQVFCRLQPDFGLCQSYHPMFYFDINTRHCKGFSYSGCGGNANRFSTYQLCSTICARGMAVPSNF